MGERPGYIYFAEMTRLSLVKIGYATDVPSRLASLRTSSPFEIREIAQYFGTKEDERKLQRLLKPIHYKREWFRYTDDIYDLIEDIYDYQLSVIAKTPGWVMDPNAREPLADVLDVPLGGFWAWRDEQIALSEAQHV